MEKITLKEFKENYFYKTDLIKLCHEYRLPTYGTKAELNHYLYLYLTGTPANEINPKRTAQTKKTLTANDITLETKLVGSGFSFNNEARKFFADYFNVEHFSFKKEMAIIKRQAETDNDTNMTVRDLITQSMTLKECDRQRLKALTSTNEESTYQWNNFVKAFCQSSESHQFTNKLKVAAILWQHVKESKQSKQYSDELVKKFTVEINPFRKR